MSETSESSDSNLVARFEKNKREEVRISVDNFHGKQLINMRVYYKGDAGEWLPGKQGLAISVDRYRDLAEAVLTLGQHLQIRGQLGSGGAA